MIPLTPAFQLTKDTRHFKLYGDIVSGNWDELSVENRLKDTPRIRKRTKPSFNNEDTVSVADEVADSSSSKNATVTYLEGEVPIMFSCNYKVVWRNMPLFNFPRDTLYLSLEPNNRAKIMPSLIDQALSEGDVGRSLRGFKNTLEKYTAMGDLQEESSLSRVDIVLRRVEDDEELCRFEGISSCTMTAENNMKSIFNVYSISSTRNAGRLKRLITTGAVEASSKPTTTSSTDDTRTDVDNSRDDSDGINTETPSVPEKKNKVPANKYVVPKLTESPVLFNNLVCNENLSPLLAKIYHFVRVNQAFREKCIAKKEVLEGKTNK